jgi:hypothetical protein
MQAYLVVSLRGILVQDASSLHYYYIIYHALVRRQTILLDNRTNRPDAGTVHIFTPRK